MISATLLLFALLLGYAVSVSLLLALTFAFRSTPDLILSGSRIQPRFKVIQQLLWLFSCIAGGFVTALIGATRPWIAALALIAVLVFMLWKNDTEARQRGFVHQVAISIVTALGVVIGFAIRTH
jgi:hypothetical protein